ncbi:MAG: SDR family oxidoreductase [Anaerolineales bacterium]
MPVDLKGKVVLITGASSGFGREAAHLFAQEGCKVALAARRLNRLQELADQIQDLGGEAIAIPVDVTQRAEIDIMLRSLLDIYGKIDILFNNAGFGSVEFFEDLDPERDIETQVQVNLTGLMLVTRAVLPHMIARQQGHIINMVSISAWISAPTYTVYGAAKAGVRSFTNALRREVARQGIHVSAIYPAPSKTEFTQKSTRKHRKPGWFKYLFIPPERVAQRVVDLAERPRRAVTLPGWFPLIGFFDFTAPAIVDWFMDVLYTKRIKRQEKK